MALFSRLSSVSLVLLAVAGLAACSHVSTTIYPQANHRYKAVALSSSEGAANKGALKKAREVCVAQGKQLNTIRNKTIYQGVGKDFDAVRKTAARVVNATTPAFISGDDDNAYKSTVVFECK